MIVKQVNQNFLIRYNFKDEKTRLVGGGQYHKLVGEKVAFKHFLAALNSKTTKTTFKIRERLSVVFVAR